MDKINQLLELVNALEENEFKILSNINGNFDKSTDACLSSFEISLYKEYYNIVHELIKPEIVNDIIKLTSAGFVSQEFVKRLAEHLKAL